jgi:DNA-binding MltR family transcriptional regulator
VRAFDVYWKGKLVDTVFFNDDCDAEYVKQSLVDHDGYQPDINVKEVK